jgi:hypothetical protein
MERWVPLTSAERRESILSATSEHDFGWGMHDDAPIVDRATGRIIDFRELPLALRHAVWPRSVAQLASDPWAAALVAHHAVFVYDRFRKDPAWDEFFDTMERLRTGWLRATPGLTLEDLQRDYVYVRLGDLTSLTFCCGWTDEQQFAGHRIALRDSRLTITPDPFGGQEFPIEVRARMLPLREFTSDSDAAAELRDATLTTWAGTAVGHNGA